MASKNLLIYLLRRDLRLEDNPIFHNIATESASKFTHLLPVYVFPAQQIETSGFVPKDSEKKSPYPEARSKVGRFLRCGPHRARWIAESVWDLKEVLQGVGSGLEIRVGVVGDALSHLLEGFEAEQEDGKITIGGVWMTTEEGAEEKEQEEDVKSICLNRGVEFKLWNDEKYFVDDRDVPSKDPEDPVQDLPNVFKIYNNMVEPLRTKPRAVLPTPISLLPLPPRIPPQALPFEIPDTYKGILDSLLEPINRQPLVEDPPEWPAIAKTAHPFHGGTRTAHERLNHLISSGAMTNYKQTRNGLLGDDFSTKFSAWLSLGSITARQIHATLVEFEDGTSDLGKDAPGYGGGENEGTYAVRYELMWRDYMRLCTRKFGTRLFSLGGFKKDTSYPWKAPDVDEETKTALSRFLSGTTGMGLIDASQRELFLTGYTSNRARQNVASYLGKRLDIDWRVGAEWYETMLIDYDVSSNWGNWQYVVNIGNNPKNNPPFNQVMQGGRYDPAGDYPRTWVKELGDAHEQALSLNNASGNGDDITGSPPPHERDWRLLPSEYFQAWTMPLDKQKALGLSNVLWVNKPLIKINFTVGAPQNQRSHGRGSDGSRGGIQGAGGRGHHTMGSGGRGSRGGGGGGNRGFHSMTGRGGRGGSYGNAPSGQGFGRGGGTGMGRVYRGHMTGVGGDRGRGGRGWHPRGLAPVVATSRDVERPERNEEKAVATAASVEVDEVET